VLTYGHNDPGPRSTTPKRPADDQRQAYRQRGMKHHRHGSILTHPAREVSQSQPHEIQVPDERSCAESRRLAMESDQLQRVVRKMLREEAVKIVGRVY